MALRGFTVPAAARAGLIAGALLLASAALGPLACSYSPNIESGKLSCSVKGECPRDFTCATSGTFAGRCVNGSGLIGGGVGGSTGLPDGGTVGVPEVRPDLRFDAPALDAVAGTGGAGGGPGTGGGTDAGVPSTVAASYLGTWAFDTGANVYADCGATYGTSNNSLANTTLTISASTAGSDVLDATWSVWPDCPYELYLDDLGLHVTDASSWACQDTSKDPSVYWYLGSFDVVTSNGRTGTHDAYYQQTYVYADGTYIYCDQLVHAAMTKR